MRLILAYIMYIYLFFRVWSIKNNITIKMLKLQLILNFIMSMADVHGSNSVVYLLEKSSCHTQNFNQNRFNPYRF